MLLAVPPLAGEMSLAEAQGILAEEKADANLLFSLSFYFEQAGRPFSAIRAVERAIEADPKVPGFHARLGQLLASRKRLKEAAAAYGRAADMDPATKSFRAAEARALSACWMLPDAARSWRTLLDVAATPEEVKDSARNLAGIRNQMADPAGAEEAWTVALGKLEAWDDRLYAADQASSAMLVGKAPARAMNFWEALLEKEAEWTRRAAIAEQLAGVAAHPAALFGQQGGYFERAEKAWRKLLDDAQAGPDKQRAALAVAGIELRSSSPEQAVAVLEPVLYAGEWAGNLSVADALARAHAARGDAVARMKLWREFLEKSGDYSQRSQVAERIAGCIEPPGELVKFRQEMAAAFPAEASAHELLARALAAAGRPVEAVDAYEALLPLVKRRKGYDVGHEYGYWQEMVRHCADADRPDRALELMRNRFAAVDDHWQVVQWLNRLRNSCGEYAALNAADRLAESGGVRRLGAGQFLLGSVGSGEAARPLLEAAAADKGLKRELRQEALRSLMGVARNGAERAELARRMVSVGGDNRWEQGRLLGTLAGCLAGQGAIEEAAEAVRQADKVRENSWRAGPDVLNQMAGGVFQGSRVGPGLRTAEGQKKAEDAAENLYKDLGGELQGGYAQGFAALLGNLAELHARRGDYDGAVGFLHRMCAVRDSSGLRLAAAELLERQGADEKALAEHLAYADALAAEHADALRRLKREEWHGLPGVDGRFLNHLEAKGRDEAYVRHAGERMEKLSGRDREGVADVLLAFDRQRNRPEDMQEVLKKLKAWGHGSRFYSGQEQWAAKAIEMKNAASQADAQRREQLLKQAAEWEKRLAANPEDYGAAINAYKTYVLLGRKESDGRKFLDRVKETAEKHRDPLVLELWGRELMLEKMYANAAKAFELAAAVTGRRTDYEESIVSALELSGKHREAVVLALDSVEEGRRGGRGFRTVEQILDMAERSDNLKHLHAEAKKRVAAAAKAARPLREEMARLALRLAWDNADDELAGAAIDALAVQASDPARPWQNEWQLNQLAERAVERRRLADAIRVWKLILDSHAAAGYESDVSEHQALAMQLLEVGRGAEAAGVMFSGLSRAGQGLGAAPRPRPGPRPLRGGAADAPAAGPAAGGAPLMRREVSLPWTVAVLSLAAREAESGGKDFREAAGDRLTALIEAEMGLLAKNPAGYAGPVLGVDSALGLRERVTGAFRAAARAEGASTADHLALATRLVSLATVAPAEKRPKGIEFKEIDAECQAAAGSAEPSRKGATLLAIARLHRQLLAGEEKDRLPGAGPEKALAAYEAAAGAGLERWGLDALHEALELARKHKAAEKALAYARKLHEAFPRDPAMRQALAGALLAAGEIKEALGLLNGGLEKNSTPQDFLNAAELCLTAKEPPAAEAAAGAADFLKSAIAAYIEEVGTQVDAGGRPLPDAELGRLQGRLSAASAAEGRPEAALAALIESLANAGEEEVPGPETAALLAAAYARAGKTAELLAGMEEKVRADPKSLNLRLAQATVLEKAGKPGEAAAALAVAKSLKPELSIVKRLVEMLRKAGQAREALAECRDWAASFPRDPEAYKAMAGVYRELKDEEGEVAALTMLVEVAPREAANCRQVAVLFAGRKDWPRATALMERAVELRPEEPYRHVDLAEVLYMSAADAEVQRAAPLLERAAGICRDALSRDWEKGLSPELLARMPPWKGTFEVRASSLLGDVSEALKKPEEAARARLGVPAGYKRPELEKAVPVPGVAGNPWALRTAVRRGGWIEE